MLSRHVPVLCTRSFSGCMPAMCAAHSHFSTCTDSIRKVKVHVNVNMNKFSLSNKEVPPKKREKQCYETGTLSPIKQPKGFKDPGLRSDLSPVEIT